MSTQPIETHSIYVASSLFCYSPAPYLAQQRRKSDNTKGCCKGKNLGSGWVIPGPFWMENRQLKNQEKNKIFDDYCFPKKMNWGVDGLGELYPFF